MSIATKKRQEQRSRNRAPGPGRARPTRQRLSPRTLPLGVPDSQRHQLTYADVIHLAPGASIAQYTFRGNSVYDPDFTSTGHQPYYRDQLAALYTRYRVYGSMIRVSAMNEAVESGLQISLIPNTAVYSMTGGAYPLEFPHAKSLKLLGVGGINTVTGYHRMTTRQLLGLRPREVLDQDYSALIGAQPSSEWYWMVVAQDISPAINVATTMQITITYDVEFYDRELITPSEALTANQIQQSNMRFRQSVQRKVSSTEQSTPPDGRSGRSRPLLEKRG